MKKRKIALMFLSGACVLALSAGIAGCAEADLTSGGAAGESATLVTNKAPDKLTPEDVIYAFLQKQSELTSYEIRAEGTAVASFANYRQEIHNITYKNGDDYLNQASSESVLVNMKHQSFSKGGKVVYRNSFDGEMEVATQKDYKKVYGFTADEVTLGGFIINPKTLRYAERKEAEGDTLTYHFRLAGDQSVENGSATESATALIRYQAKAYGSLGNLPSYSDVDVYLTIKDDWTPVSYTSSCSYTAKKVFDMSVEENMTSVYSKVNEEVTIPSVKEFNDKLGTTPSEVKPVQGETNALMQLTTAFGNTMDENGVLALPITVGVETDGKAAALDGKVTLKLKEEALESGALTDAFTARLDIDLTKIPLISGIANTLTVRYPGDGVLLVALNNRAEGKDNNLFTYSVDLGGALASPDAGGIDLEQLQNTLGEYLSLEETETGFTIALQDAAVAKLNEAFGGMLGSLKAKLGDTNGYISALLGVSFSGAEARLTVEKTAEKITGIAVSAEIQPSESVSLGEKIAVSLDTKLMSGALARPFTGDLEIHLDMGAILTGDYYAAVKAHLRLDLTPASSLFMLIGMLGGMIPNLPSYINQDLTSLDIYYTGDGILTLAFNNQNDLPMGMVEVDLKTLIGESSAATKETPAPSDPAETQPTFSLLPFTLTVSENGLKLALGEPAVKAIAAAYSGLIESLIAKASENDTTGLAGAFLGPWLRAEITGVEFFLGTTDEGKLTFDLAVIATYQNSSNTPESGRFIGLTITDKQTLTSEESADLVADKAVGELKAANEKATEYAEKLQKFIDGMDVTDAGYAKYVEAVTALQNEIDGQDPAVKTLMSNNSYLAVKTYQGKQYSVLLLTAELCHTRATDFKANVQTITADSDEEDWDALNALYDKAATVSDIQVPAVKESKVLKTAIGEDTIANYLAKRAAHESKLARELTEQIAAAKTAFEAEENQNRDGWTQGLTKIVKEFKPIYDKLPDNLKEGTGYQEFVKQVYTKNIEEVTRAYNEVEVELEALKGSDPSLDNILSAMKKLSAAYAWGYGYDYWVANTATVIQPWGETWLTALKPTDLSEDEQKKVSELNTLNRSFLKGDIAKEILNNYAELIKTEVGNLYVEIGDCRKVVDGTEHWDFERLEGDKDVLLEKIHGIRFLICKVLPANLFNDWEDETLLQFARIDLTKYETALMKDLAGQGA